MSATAKAGSFEHEYFVDRGKETVVITGIDGLDMGHI